MADDLRGLDSLRRVGRDEQWPPRTVTDAELLSTARTARALPGFDDLVATLERDRQGVIMTMGKGGVGKTTLAARLAVALAARGYPVHLSTTDPAAHVEDALGEFTRGESAADILIDRIDPTAEVRRYTGDVIAAAGELEPDERALLEEDLKSPCTEEIAVFRAFARTVAEAERGFVVLDTAPTGHTLLLLDAAESYHREVARASGSQATPVLEAARLQDDLRRAGIEPFGWVVNASLAAAGTRDALLAARARLEVPHIQRVADELAREAWLIPWHA